MTEKENIEIRDPEKIDEYVKMIGRCWKRRPQWSFNQLMGNIENFIEHQGQGRAPWASIYYIEDDIFFDYVKDLYKEGDEEDD